MRRRQSEASGGPGCPGHPCPRPLLSITGHRGHHGWMGSLRLMLVARTPWSSCVCLPRPTPWEEVPHVQVSPRSDLEGESGGAEWSMWCLVHGRPELCTRRRKRRSGLHLPPGLLTVPLLVSAEMPPLLGSLPCLPPALPAVAVGLSLGLDLGAFEGRPCSFSGPSCLKECLEPQQVPRDHRTNDGVGSSEYPRACGGRAWVPCTETQAAPL